MRGAIAVATGIALVGALTVPSESGWTVRNAGAETAGCSWQRHSKRVVKQVRRHGRARRVAHTKHWWSCDPLPMTPVAAPPITPTPAPPAPQPEATVAHLGVKAEEFRYTLSRPQVPPGEVIVELSNQGEDAHNLNLQPVGSEEPPLEVGEAQPSEHRVGRFTLAAGTYRLWCSLLTHDEEGMHATLVVGGG